jgi:hypothetical protein
MAVVQVIENGGARLEVIAKGKDAQLIVQDSDTDAMGISTIDLDADDLKALIKRCKVVLAQLEG